MQKGNVFLILLLGLALLSAWYVHKFLAKKIDPRSSTKNFFLYMFLHIAAVFILVFIFGFLIIYFKEFFIKK